ncbi:MAG: hypothetical protein ACOCUI_00520, partial [bacterium]
SAKLYEGEHYEDQETGQDFDKLIIVMKGKWERLLETRMGLGFHENFPVSMEEVECSFIHIGWAMPNIPILILTWTENMKENQLNETLNAANINYIEMQVLRRIVTNWRSFSKKAELEIQQYIAINEMLSRAYDELRQRIQLFPVEKLRGHTDIVVDDARSKTETAKLYIKIIKILLIVIGIIVALWVTFTILGYILEEPPLKPAFLLI